MTPIEALKKAQESLIACHAAEPDAERRRDLGKVILDNGHAISIFENALKFFDMRIC